MQLSDHSKIMTIASHKTKINNLIDIIKNLHDIVELVY